MSDVTKAVEWLRAAPWNGPRQRANAERCIQLILQMDHRIELLRRRDDDLSTEVMELRALVNAYRALGDPNWATEG